MTLNRDQRNHDQEQLYNDAVQSEIRDILAHDGSQNCWRVAQKVGKSLQETRWHLEQMHRRGDISYRLGRYGL